MTIWALLAIAGRITGSCLASLWQKRLFQAGESSLRIVAVSMTIVAMTVIAISVASAGSFDFDSIESLPAAFWIYLLASAFLDTLGNFLLVRSVGEGELSVVGPLNSLKPVVVMILGVAFFQEMPSFLGVVGVSAIVLGSWWLLSPNSTSTSRSWRISLPVWVRIASIVFTSIASLYLKQAIDLSTPWQSFQGWAVLSSLIAWISVAWQEKKLSRRLPVDYLYLGWAVVLMQGLTIWLFSQMPVGYALALFQLSSLIQVVMGARLFGESNFRQRLMASSVMAIGAIVVLGCA